MTYFIVPYTKLSCTDSSALNNMVMHKHKSLFARYSHPVEHFSCLLCLLTCCVMTDLTRIARTLLGIAFYRSVLRASYIYSGCEYLRYTLTSYTCPVVTSTEYLNLLYPKHCSTLMPCILTCTITIAAYCCDLYQ